MHLSSRLVTMASLAAPRCTFALLRVHHGLSVTATSRRSTGSASSAGSNGSKRNRSTSTNAKIGDTCVVSAALQLLGDKKKLVENISQADYAFTDDAVGASVGGHVRHALDHFSKCLAAARPPAATGTPRVDGDHDYGTAPTDNTAASSTKIRYDHRVRGGSVETDPKAASQLISSLLKQLQALPQGTAGLRAIRVAPTFMVIPPSDDGEGVEHEFESNLERELFFCCHHGIHHDAMIQLILRGMGERGENVLCQVKQGFGVAPSTVDFRRNQKGEEVRERQEQGER